MQTKPSARREWVKRRSALFRAALAPAPRLTVSEWADRYRHLSREASAEPGRWSTARAPYQRGILDAFSDPLIEKVVVMSSAQVGKTEIVNNVVGYFIDKDPAPILVLQPTQQMGEAWSKDRLAPMLRDTPRLRGKVKDPRARDSGNTLLHKALALDTPLPTPEGWTTVGEVRVGDTLFDERGQPCRVTDLTPVYLGRRCYRVRFSDGEEIVADAGHLWAVERWVVKKRPKPHQAIVRELLTTADMVGRVRSGKRFRFAVPTTEPLKLADARLPVPPYALGVWLGDGYSHRAAVVMEPADATEVLGHLRAEGLDATIRPVAGRGIVEILLEPLTRNTRRGADGRMIAAEDGVRGALRSMDLVSRAGSGRSKKVIPPAYLRASEGQRWDLLQGLMDAGGSVTPQGWCRFVTVLPALADGVCELLSSLGIKWSRTDTPAGGIVLGFQSPSQPVFRLARKRERQRIPTTNATRRRIVAIEPERSVPVRCITVDSPEHLFLAGRRMVPTHNSFPGGHITISGANSAASLASRPIRVVLCDEVDRYPASAGTEGDPVALATKRTATFWNRKIGEFSTPTVKNFSRIEQSYEQSDRRRYHVPCPHCEHMQVLEWHNLKWENGDPETASYMCEACGVLIEEQHKGRMLAEGVWVAENPGHRTAGFHLNSLYSPWARWSELVREFLEAKGNPERLKVFVNTVLGQTWEEEGERVNAESLSGRREKYRAVVPDGVGLLVAAVDVQGDRLEVKVKGYGAGEESWVIHHEQLWGDPGRDEVWQMLENVRTRAWE
ncbi:MAG TPA: terminase gpA endonuclease subunit, partial [Longimicrobiaceae bacterium]